ASIYLACSGAMVDLSIDISAAIEEVIDKKPDITRKEILLSGMNIGKSVVGTQATTLLLAYMGSFIAVMMVYMAQGTPLLNILNSKSIASEVLHTFVGCIGLVIVSPLTAVICSRVYKDNGVK
ncbi:MAG: YibE/F family protein, partial [Cellulosilyticaceae bacterium]